MLTGFSTAKLIGVGIAALALIGFLAWVNSLRIERNSLRQWQEGIVTVVQSEVPVDRRKSVTAKTVGDEIRWLGREYRTASGALQSQSEKLRAAERKVITAQNSAAEASRKAAESDKSRKVARDRLIAPTRSGGLTANEWSQL